MWALHFNIQDFSCVSVEEKMHLGPACCQGSPWLEPDLLKNCSFVPRYSCCVPDLCHLSFVLLYFLPLYEISTKDQCCLPSLQQKGLCSAVFFSAVRHNRRNNRRKKEKQLPKHCLVQMVEEAEAAARCDGRPGAATKNSSISSLPHKIKNTKDLT